MLNFVNLTPHALTVEGIGTIEPSGTIARCAVVRTGAPALIRAWFDQASGSETPVPTEGGLPLPVRVVAQTMGEVVGLPAPAHQTVFIVSGMVLDAVKASGTGRAGRDVFAPDTGPDAIRNDKGHITAVRGLVS